MRIFNEGKTIELYDVDLSKGVLIDGQIQVGKTKTVAEKQEKGHYETVSEYATGGKDVRWVVTSQYVPGKESEPIYEDIKIFIPFTEVEQLQRPEPINDGYDAEDITPEKLEVALAEVERMKATLSKTKRKSSK